MLQDVYGRGTDDCIQECIRSQGLLELWNTGKKKNKTNISPPMFKVWKQMKLSQESLIANYRSDAFYLKQIARTKIKSKEFTSLSLMYRPQDPLIQSSSPDSP